jgi:hypothetical protein
MSSRANAAERPAHRARKRRALGRGTVTSAFVVIAGVPGCGRPAPTGEPAASALVGASAHAESRPLAASSPAPAANSDSRGELLAVDTPSGTYVGYADVSSARLRPPDELPTLARWQHASPSGAVRSLAFEPGDAPDVAAITRFLPLVAPAVTRIDATAPPYSAAVEPSDATRALERALSAAGARASATHPVDVVLGPGVYAYHEVLDVPANVRLYGDHATLHATNPALSALHLAGDGSGALFLRLRAEATTRLTTPDSSGIWVGPRTPFDRAVHGTLVVGNEIVGPAGAHVFGMAEVDGLWAFNDAHGGFADAFHHTGGSHGCQVIANRAAGLPGRGDDLYAFVGYEHDGDPVHHCSCIANFGTDGAARGIAAVGAGFLSIEHNVISRTRAAGIYIAREGAYATYGSFSIFVFANRITNANLDSTHDGLLAFADHPDDTTPSRTFGDIPHRVRDLEVLANTFEDTSPGRGGGFGIQVRASCSGGAVVGNIVLRSAKQAGIDVAGERYSTADNRITASP